MTRLQAELPLAQISAIEVDGASSTQTDPATLTFTEAPEPTVEPGVDDPAGGSVLLGAVIFLALVVVFAAVGMLVWHKILLPRKRAKDKGQGIVYQGYMGDHIVPPSKEVQSSFAVSRTGATASSLPFSSNSTGHAPAKSTPSTGVSSVQHNSMYNQRRNTFRPVTNSGKSGGGSRGQKQSGKMTEVLNPLMARR